MTDTRTTVHTLRDLERVDTATLPLNGVPWRESPPFPTNLPCSDGVPMESPWHALNANLLRASYVAARGNVMDDYYVGANMFIYYSKQQIRNQDYKGPDVYIVKNVDGTKKRLSWIVWEEDYRYPTVIFELLSPSTEQTDLTHKKALYEKVFCTEEYYCIAPDVERLLGWRLTPNRGYVPILPDERGWLWSAELGLWLGPWPGSYMAVEQTWARFYHPDGSLVLLPDEAAQRRADAASRRADDLAARANAERQRADAERRLADAANRRADDLAVQADAANRRADDLAVRMAQLEAELERLRSGD